MLSSKAQNLDLLKKIFKNDKNIVIPEYFYFKKKDFKKNKNKLLKKINKLNKNFELILRSSAKNEDGIYKTLAGKYSSIYIYNENIKSINLKLESFLKQFKNLNDEIIVQYKISKVNLSGVIFTSDINFNSPYYLINYDNSGKTNLITSGVKNDKKKQLVIYKPFKKKNKFSGLIAACKTLEKKIKNFRLDVEFAFKNNKIYLFQIRYLPKIKNIKFSESKFNSVIINITKKIDKITNQKENQTDQSTFFSNMADWNPAEMIGEKPNPLALSIYKELITDEVWRLQRSDYGYKDVFPNVLLFSFAGTPYVDLKIDIKSFLPKNLSPKISTIIINSYLSVLKKNTNLHDKIEFDLVETCHSFNSQKRLKKIFKKKLLKIYLAALKKVNFYIFKNKLLYKEIDKINSFEELINKIKNQKISPIQKIFFYIKVIKEYGTLPFAGIARVAFISQRIFLDIKNNKLVSNAEYNNFYNNLNLINSEISDDFQKVLKKRMLKKEFINKYGHIRPSSYDINSLNFKENFKNYFTNKDLSSKKIKKNINFKFKNKLNKVFINNYKISFNEFLKLAKNSIEYREKAKFIFTKGINEIFNSLIILGKEVGISRKDLAFLDIKNVLNFYTKLEARKLKDALKEEIKNNKLEFQIMKMIKLPDVIKSKEDVVFFEETFSKINFVTSKTLIAEKIELRLDKKNYLNNKIVLIKNADPGYDFIFNYKIKGLITMYGGSNSHMSIRCLEQDIPAAIGIGNLKYQQILKSKKILLDCNKKKLLGLNN